MKYQEFVTKVKKFLEQRLGEDYEISIQSVVKVNDMNRCGINIREKKVHISPTIYLEEYYKKYQNGMDFEKIITDIILLYNHAKMREIFDVENFNIFPVVKEKIMLKLLNLKKNKEFLRTVSYIPFSDFAIVFYILLEDNVEECSTITVTNQMLDVWNITKHDLFRIAKENTQQLMPFNFVPLSSKLADLIGNDIEEESCMYVLSNEKFTFGASCILYDDMLDYIRQQLRESFYLIPSSIHEWIVLPKSVAPAEADINSMITEVNQFVVEKEDILGDYCYTYESLKKELI